MKVFFPAGMFRFFFLLLGGAGLFATTSCKKDDPVVKDYRAIDQDIIEKYLASNNIITAQKQPSGLYFLPVSTAANGVKINVGNTVSVLYTGHLLDASGTVFDASSSHSNVPLTFVVGDGQLIPGLEEGVSLMHVGDRAELLIPSALAYGPQSSGNIPANAVLRIEVEVVNYTSVDESLITSYLATKNITTAKKQASGLYFLPVSTDPRAVIPTAGSTVSVLYTGHLLDAAGTVFDESSQHGNVPLTFKLGSKQVITGFEEGISLMHKGDRAELLIPSALAYGTRGVPPTIAPNAVLRFEVELVDVQ